MDFTSIHNYYEHMVIDYLQTHVITRMPEKSTDYFLDVACYALTKLPARYMRHEIDMAFFLEKEERVAMRDEVEKAVEDAVTYIEKNFNKDNRYGEDIE
ncbi:MAG: competence protein ComFB [Gammaproteobacteria bacterium]|nr:MAG: competence protein ComFB [Gammaproteobacteria bacterium]